MTPELAPEMTPGERNAAVMLAAGHDFNNDLTIIFSIIQAVDDRTDENDPDHVNLMEAKAAAQRCIWKASGLMNYAAKIGAPRTRMAFERLIEV